jgi:hypothetical protein
VPPQSALARQFVEFERSLQAASAVQLVELLLEQLPEFAFVVQTVPPSAQVPVAVQLVPTPAGRVLPVLVTD